MKSKLILVDTKTMNQEDWLKYRKRGIGASEVGTIMGLNPYKSSIELFYEKIGEELGYNIENMARFLGKEQEPLIADMWQYWGGDVDSMIANYRAGKIVRRCQQVHAYVHNPDYPHLFVSLDRKINKHANRGEGALELKTIAGYESDKWEGGIPPSYVVQVQTQLLVCEFDYGEMAILKNGREFDVLPFERNETIIAAIIERTLEFWRRVELAREIITSRFEAQRSFNYAIVEQCNANLQAVEPEPDGSEAFNNFLKEKYRIALPGERQGTIVELEAAKAHRAAKDRIKEFEDQARLYENKLKNSIRDGCDRLDFGKEVGYVSWKTDSNGTRRFLNKVK